MNLEYSSHTVFLGPEFAKWYEENPPQVFEIQDIYIKCAEAILKRLDIDGHEYEIASIIEEYFPE